MKTTEWAYFFIFRMCLLLHSPLCTFLPPWTNNVWSCCRKFFLVQSDTVFHTLLITFRSHKFSHPPPLFFFASMINYKKPQLPILFLRFGKILFFVVVFGFFSPLIGTIYSQRYFLPLVRPFGFWEHGIYKRLCTNRMSKDRHPQRWWGYGQGRKPRDMVNQPLPGPLRKCRVLAPVDPSNWSGVHTKITVHIGDGQSSPPRGQISHHRVKQGGQGSLGGGGIPMGLEIDYCIAGNFRRRKFSSTATFGQFVRKLFSLNVSRRSFAPRSFGCHPFA